MPCEGGPSVDNSWIEVDRLTRIACEMGKTIRRHNLANELGSTARTWLIQHERDDRRRLAEEERDRQQAAERARILKTLTPRQRKLLNL